MLQTGFAESGRAIAKEMSYADQYIPELKGIADAWTEWEADYWATAVSNSVTWFDDRIAHMNSAFPSGASLGNEALAKLMYSAEKLYEQVGQIKSPL